jgi:hypothetical protein
LGRRHASAALAWVIKRLRYIRNVRWASIYTPCYLGCSKLSAALPFTGSIGWRCLQWPHLLVNSVALVLEVPNTKPHLSAQSTLALAHACSCACLLLHRLLETYRVDLTAWTSGWRICRKYNSELTHPELVNHGAK